MRDRYAGCWVLVLSLTALVACGEAKTAAPSDAGHDATQLPGFGQACDPAVGCAKGLVCQQSDYAPKPWCTAPCPAAKIKDYCDAASIGGAAGLCVQMPASFQGPKDPFCAPICSNLAVCQGIDPVWELCSKLEYKKNVLITDLPTKVCLAPSANGQVKVDPVLCDWEDKVQDPLLSEAVQQCKSVCKNFLIPCQYWPKPKTEACCGWACMQYVTPGGQLDNDRLSKDIKCLGKAFAAFQGTPQMCTGWQDQSCPMPAALNPDGK